MLLYSLYHNVNVCKKHWLIGCKLILKYFFATLNGFFQAFETAAEKKSKLGKCRTNNYMLGKRTSFNLFKNSIAQIKALPR